jgi:hypothetical protein
LTAQTSTLTDPLNPQPQIDARIPPRVQRFTRAPLPQLGAAPVFVAPASGAGIAGFDSSNNRKKVKAKANANVLATPSPKAIAPGPAAPLALTPQTPVTSPEPSAGSAAASAMAQVPAAQPIEIGPIRRPPKKLKPHEEPEDPYAPLGVHAGSFMLFSGD